MALFMAKSADKAATPAIDIDALRVEVARLKEDAKIRAKYGGGLSDEQVTYYVEKEREKAQRIADKPARLAAIEGERERMRETLRQIARDELKAGRFRVHVNEKPVEVGSDLVITCPHCGGACPSASGYLSSMADHVRGITNRYQLVDSFHRHHGTMIYGAPVLQDQATCEKCGQRSNILIQLVL